MKPLYAKLLRRNKFLAQRTIALVLGLEYTLLSSRCAKGTFSSEHEVFDTIYYYRGAARSATNI